MSEPKKLTAEELRLCFLPTRAEQHIAALEQELAETRAEVERLKAELADARDRYFHAKVEAERNEACIRALEEKLGDVQHNLGAVQRWGISVEKERDAARAQAARLRKALKAIAANEYMENGACFAWKRAREALKAEEGK